VPYKRRKHGSRAKSGCWYFTENFGQSVVCSLSIGLGPVEDALGYGMRQGLADLLMPLGSRRKCATLVNDQ
jgi:hypothetical protein